MICHHCGHKEAHPHQCVSCAMPNVKFFGLSTQKLEEDTRKAFPQAKVARLDSDVGRQGYLKILRDFMNREIDILVGTQMIAKGLDLPHLSTVGVVAADTSFMQLDYQAEERGFQLLTQVAGRAGRRDKQGRVIFQTYDPERLTLIDASKQDYKDFYQKEISDRKDMQYPPFSTVARVVCIADAEAAAIKALEDLQSFVLAEVSDSLKPQLNMLGPSPCVLSKLKGQYRQHLLLRFVEQESLRIFKNKFLEFKRKQDQVLILDVDSISLY